MKKILLSLLLPICINVGYTQSYPCDIAQTGLSISPQTIAIGQTAEFKFTIYNAGTNTGCAIPAGSAQVILSLPRTLQGLPRYYQFVGVVSPTLGLGSYFTYQYDLIDNVVIGTNQSPIPNGEGEADVTIRVIGIEATPAAGATSNLNLQQSGGISNNTGNDISSAPLIVTATILPAKLGSFNASNKACTNTIEWETLQEDNLKSFAVEAGKNANDLKKIATVAAAGNSTVRRSYSYTEPVSLEGDIYYRLKMIDADGKFSYSNTVKVKSNCNAKKVSIYPNPILLKQQQVTVSVAGYGSKIKGELLSATGQLVKTYSLTNGTNNLAVENLSLGTYILKITDALDGSFVSHKILVIK